MPEFVAQTDGLTHGDEVELFIIDLTVIGHAAVFYFTPSRKDGGSLWFGDNEYLSRGIKADGFKRSSTDEPAEPTLTVLNVDKGGYALLNDYGELLGAKVTRIKTFVQFLDKDLDGNVNPNAEPTAHFIPEIWYVEHKPSANRVFIQFRLKAATDIRDKKVPGRIVLKNFCTRPYRVWDADLEDFVYPTAFACPYAGSNYFKADGTPTMNPAEDRCSKGIDDGCALRFPGETLPTYAFPGVAKVPRR